MKLPAHVNKWGPAVLGVVSLLLIANLMTQYRGMQPAGPRPHTVRDHTAAAPGAMAQTTSGGSRAARPGASAAKTSAHAADDLAKYDPTVHFTALKAQDSRPLPDEDRNPFQFVGEVVPVAPVVAAAPVVKPVPVVVPPPPPPLKAMGYNELPGGKKEAMLTYNDDLEVVHEGDTIGEKYKVVAINPAMVVVEDDEHKTIQLPFPP